MRGRVKRPFHDGTMLTRVTLCGAYANQNDGRQARRQSPINIAASSLLTSVSESVKMNACAINDA
jgi:hypothetical protein